MLKIKYGLNHEYEFPAYISNDYGWYIGAEIETKNFFIEKIQKKFNIIDAGAQIGMYSILFSKLAYEGKIFSFEPTDNSAMLEKNIQHNQCDNVEILKFALSNKDGIYNEKIFKIWSQNIVEQKNFYFMTIDSFVKERNLNIDLIKIDVDSYDYEVLLGSKNTLITQNPIVVVELNHALEKRGFFPKHAVDFMKSINYNIIQVLDKENYIFGRNI